MTIIRVQAVFTINGRTNDRVTNVFHFTSSDAFSISGPNAAAVVEGFYQTTRAPNPGPLGAILPPWLNRSWITRTYNLDDPAPRTPLIAAHTLPAPLSSVSSVPAECSAVLTLSGAAPVTRRTRGRVFLPLTASLLAGGDASNPPTIPLDGTLWLRASAAAQGIKDSTLVDWVIRSEATTPAVHTPVAAVSMDVDPDIQRRRGLNGGARVSLTLS